MEIKFHGDDKVEFTIDGQDRAIRGFNLIEREP